MFKEYPTVDTFLFKSISQHFKKKYEKFEGMVILTPKDKEKNNRVVLKIKNTKYPFIYVTNIINKSHGRSTLDEIETTFKKIQRVEEQADGQHLSSFLNTGGDVFFKSQEYYAKMFKSHPEDLFTETPKVFLINEF